MTEANSKTSETHEAKHDSSFVKDQSSLFDLARLKELGGYEAGDLLAVDPELYEKFMMHLNRTVKRDVITKNMSFLTCLSAYTSQPLNLFLRGESSIGKTYNIMQVSNYFPQKDVWRLGGLSKRALVHGFGVLVDQNNEEIDFSKKPQKPAKGEYANEYDYREAIKEYKEAQETWLKRLQNSRYLVDLTGKILLFLEPPDFETFMALRPILSHDAYEISYKIVDKTAKGKLQTKHVIIRGWPACVFCSTREKYVQDLATRGFTVTPETTTEKYRNANILTGEKAALPWKFRRDFDFALLEGYIRSFKNKMEELQVLIPYGKQQAEKFPSKFPRTMRDFKHILTLIKVFTQFHFAQRPVLGSRYILASRQDYDFVMGLWEKIRETTETSAPGQIMKFFHEVAEKVAEGQAEFLIQDLVEEWNGRFEEKKSSSAIRKWVDFLCDVGYMTKNPNPKDKRSNVLSIIKPKNSENVGFYLAEFFKLDSFKEWLNDVKKHCVGNNLHIRENLVSHNETSIEDIFQKYFLYTETVPTLYFPHSSRASFDERTEEKTNFQKPTQFPNFKAFNVADVSKLERLTVNIQNKCIECGFSGRVGWQVTLHDGSWGMLCGKCGDRLAEKMRDEKTRDDSPQRKPTGMFQCPICAKFNKPMVFANEEDLKVHMARLHSGSRERALSKLASSDMLHILRDKFREKFVDVEFSNFIVKHGWTRTEADIFFKKLVDDGQLFKTPGGLWLWA